MKKVIGMAAVGMAFLLGANSSATADNKIENRIESRIEKDKQLKGTDINVDVDDKGIATLKGTVSTGGEKLRAEQLAHIKGVRHVENDIAVAVPQRDVTDHVRYEGWDNGEAVTDSWITAKVKVQFVGEDALDGSDINVDTEEDVVTLRGTVASESARQRANEIARTTKGVKRVDDKLTVARKR